MPDVLARGAIGIQPGCSFTEIYVELWRLWQTDKTAFPFFIINFCLTSATGCRALNSS
jgi:hypothetical protein